MRSIIIKIGLTLPLLLTVHGIALSQASLKTNIPLWLTGSPNIGAEITLASRFTLHGEVAWLPYMFKKKEEVFRVLMGSVEFRYFLKPSYYYTNQTWDGWYIGPYSMYGQFNIGFFRKGEGKESYRRRGWAVSEGISTGYMFYLTPRLKLDLNIGVGYAHLQYNKYFLGGEYSSHPVVGGRKITKAWIGPTKFGVHLTYNLFR